MTYPLRRPVLPISAIRVFEAAAFHENFTKAAGELGMTQAAVSYQIKVLEERIGAEMFERLPRGVRLTEHGERLAQGTLRAFDLLREAYAEASDGDGDNLTISCVPTFAVQFLASRLGGFQLANPQLSVKIDVSQHMADFRSDGVDIAIRMGEGNWPGLKAHKLVDLRSTPLLAPSLASRIGGVRRPGDLLKLPLIGIDDGWWENWFAAAGMPAVGLPEGLRLDFDLQAAEANAALAGRGVGRLSALLYRSEIEQGRLVRPFAIELPDGPPLWLVYPNIRRNAPKIVAFRKWIFDEVSSRL